MEPRILDYRSDCLGINIARQSIYLSILFTFLQCADPLLDVELLRPSPHAQIYAHILTFLGIYSIVA